MQRPAYRNSSSDDFVAAKNYFDFRDFRGLNAILKSCPAVLSSRIACGSTPKYANPSDSYKVTAGGFGT